MKQSYKQLIDQRIISTELLADCLYSVNERAKKCKDQEQTCRALTAAACDEEDCCRKNKYKYYRMKVQLLSTTAPTCIHVAYVTETKRYYGYDPYSFEIPVSAEVVEEGGFYDVGSRNYVHYIDTEQIVPQYYLFFDLGAAHGFHIPISLPARYALPMVESDIFAAKHEDDQNLVPMKCVKEVLKLIESGDFTYQETSAPSEHRILQAQNEGAERLPKQSVHEVGASPLAS